MSEKSRRRRELLTQFGQWWDSDESPDVQQFVLNHKITELDILIDILELDRHERWARNERIRAETYLKAFPQIAEDAESALVIIYGEYYLRQEKGESPSLMEYVARFPRFARRLRDQVMWHEAIDLGTPEEVSHRGMPKIPGYTLQHVLGQGGMSTVYQALNEDTSETVAIKILDAQRAEDTNSLARFHRESETLLRLNHANIVRGFQMGQVRNRPYLVMEYCTGGTLSKKIQRQPQPNAIIRHIVPQICHALDILHELGIIHRDLKPSNILLADAATPLAVATAKLADFGLAKLQQDDFGAITATQDSLGTPSYMAPELTTSAREADQRTDIYGLGTIIYELATGRPPFTGEHPLEVLEQVRHSPPTAIRDYNPEIDSLIETACFTCLAKNPDDRYSDIKTFLSAFYGGTVSHL